MRGGYCTSAYVVSYDFLEFLSREDPNADSALIKKGVTGRTR
jgi:hypothetical protein